MEEEAGGVTNTKAERLPLLLVTSGFLIATIIAGYEVYCTSTASSPSATASSSGVAGQGRGSSNPPARGGIRLHHRSGQQGGGAAHSAGSDVGGVAPVRSGIVPQQTAGAASAQGSNDNSRQGSSGDSTRRSFYRLLFLALLSRLLLLPLEAYYFTPSSHHVHPHTGMCAASPGCIFSRTLPDMAFASAFSLLVLFYAQLVGTASGGSPRGLTLLLTKPGLFATANLVVYALYGLLFFLTGFVPIIPYTVFQTIVWSILCAVYLLLLCLLSYFGPVLVTLLKPSLARRSGLAARLIIMCVLCAAVFLSRTVCFGLAVLLADVKYTNGLVSNLVPDDTYSHFGRDLIGYSLLELGPALAILALMHQSKRQRSAGSSPDAGAGTTPPTPNPPAGHGHGAGRAVGTVTGMKRVTSGSAPKRQSGAGKGEAAPLVDKMGSYGAAQGEP